MMAYVDSDPSIHSRNDPAPGERPAFSDLLDRLIREAEQQSRPADAAPDTPTDAPAYAPTENGMPGNAPSGNAPSGSTAASAPPRGNGLLGSLLSSPQALQAIPALMSSLGPLLSSLSASRPTGTATPAGDAPTGAAPAGSAPAGGHPAKKGAPNRHTALLCAIKPYLGSERRQAVESMVQLLKVFDAVQDMGQLLPTPQKPSAHDGKEET